MSSGASAGWTDSMSAAVAATCGVAIDVPMSWVYVSPPGEAMGAVALLLDSDTMVLLVPEMTVPLPPPGALMAVCAPTLAYQALSPSRVWAVTAMAPAQLAGASTGPDSLPAATTMVTPSARAALIRLCSSAEQAPVPPRLMLMTLAGVGLLMTPGTAPPASHVIASMMSDVTPPHLPNALRQPEQQQLARHLRDWTDCGTAQ